MTNKPAKTANSPITRRLSAVRRAEGCATATEFAAVLGISTNRYSDIEAGSDLSIEIAQLIVGKCQAAHLTGFTTASRTACPSRYIGD
jgi:transcriptional regulator with XRE-family HTH domain